MGISSLFGGSADTTPADHPATPVLSVAIPNDSKKLFCCRVLGGGDDVVTPSRNEKRRAWKQLEKQMAMVPGGSVPMVSADPIEDIEHPDNNRRAKMELFDASSFYMDRMTVTCGEYALFVRNGGYADLNLWPNVVWAHIVQFVDQSGAPGPRNWNNGRPPREWMDHPVTGICWYEARAYARWVGKSLPTPVQWQRACTWHTNVDGRYSNKMYPWGDLFDPQRANLWGSGLGQTVPVDSHYEGCTPNGIAQMIGNVWEWVDAAYAGDESPEYASGGLCEIRGGAYDTYFPRQATCQFRTGQPRLFRPGNTGFRCCVEVDDLKHRVS